MRERQLETRRAVVDEVVAVEGDDGAAGAEVEQHVGGERDDRRRVEVVAEQLDHAGDGAARIRESGQRDD